MEKHKSTIYTNKKKYTNCIKIYNLLKICKKIYQIQFHYETECNVQSCANTVFLNSIKNKL